MTASLITIPPEVGAERLEGLPHLFLEGADVLDTGTALEAYLVARFSFSDS